MKFSELAASFNEIDQTASRNEMTALLAGLFKKATPDELEKITYLSLGRLAPLYEPVEFGMADKSVVMALARAFDIDQTELTKDLKSLGDVGELARKVAKNDNFNESVTEVFEKLYQLAMEHGAGSVERKSIILADLLRDADEISAKYLAKIPTGKLRLGFSDMTILDALSVMETGDKSIKKTLENFYNLGPDLGRISKIFKQKGLGGLSGDLIKVGTPVLMARCERLNDAKEILEKSGGKVALEPKYDGFRLQVHLDRKGGLKTRDKDGEIISAKVKLFTRNLEDVTYMYPDIVEGTLKEVKADRAIFEGEALAYEESTGEFRPFQETVQRKRKHGIEAKVLEIPLRLFVFEFLYSDGVSLIDEPYEKRRETMRKSFNQGEIVVLSEEVVATTEKEIEDYFVREIERGLEGIVAKKLDGVYQAGARGWNWIKYKRGFSGKNLTDTIDCVVLGYDYGSGKRAKFGIGDFLIGVYDEDNDCFTTIAKVGTGLTDEEWVNIRESLDEIKTDGIPKNVVVKKLAEVDVWADPQIVVVIRADEITKSPMHTTAEKDGLGLALRFPRLIEFGRKDKKPTDATSVGEIVSMYNGQKKQKST